MIRSLLQFLCLAMILPILMIVSSTLLLITWPIERLARFIIFGPVSKLQKFTDNSK